MVNVTNRANVDVRLVPLKLTFCHVYASLKYERRAADPRCGAGLRSRLELSRRMRKQNCA
jgi:hypothetical protein